MTQIDLSPHTALVVVDLQHGITALPTVEPADDIVGRAATLAHAFRERERPVVLVNVDLLAGRPGIAVQRVDAEPPPMDLGPDFTTLRPELGQQPGDLVVTKRGWDAFCATELDMQLRRRGVTSIVLAGIRTAVGVESTARTAFALGYEVVFATDAITDVSAEAAENSLLRIYPRLGRLSDTATIAASV
ncbi:MAG TPA: isochorismatase family protein [Baekduia sp.]